MIWIWIGVVISLLLIEYMSKNFTAICFVISGIISCILTHFHTKWNFKCMGIKINLSPYMVQLLVFLIVGIFLILVIRPQFLKWIEKRKQKKDIEVKKVIGNKKEKRKQNKKSKKKK